MVILVAACVLAGAVVGRAGGQGGTGLSLGQLEVRVAGANASGQDWLAYAQRLGEAGRYGHAAAAYRKVLEEEPGSPVARAGCALALAGAGETAALRGFVGELVLHDPQAALELLELGPCAGALGAGTTAVLQSEARMQMMD